MDDLHSRCEKLAKTEEGFWRARFYGDMETARLIRDICDRFARGKATDAEASWAVGVFRDNDNNYHRARAHPTHAILDHDGPSERALISAREARQEQEKLKTLMHAALHRFATKQQIQRLELAEEDGSRGASFDLAVAAGASDRRLVYESAERARQKRTAGSLILAAHSRQEELVDTVLSLRFAAETRPYCADVVKAAADIFARPEDFNLKANALIEDFDWFWEKAEQKLVDLLTHPDDFRREDQLLKLLCFLPMLLATRLSPTHFSERARALRARAKRAGLLDNAMVRRHIGSLATFTGTPDDMVEYLKDPIAEATEFEGVAMFATGAFYDGKAWVGYVKSTPQSIFLNLDRRSRDAAVRAALGYVSHCLHMRLPCNVGHSLMCLLWARGAAQQIIAGYARNPTSETLKVKRAVIKFRTALRHPETAKLYDLVLEHLKTLAPDD
jgi:hypothetical protein